MKKNLLISIASVAAITGCATAYQPKGPMGGFDETQLDTNVWRVSFKGNGYTKGERAEDFATLRSAELALANGFTHFAFVESKTGSELSTYTAPRTSYTTGRAEVVGNTLYLNATTNTYGGGTFLMRRPSATNTVVMFKGRPDGGGMVYDANFICSSIGQKYKVICNAPK